MAYFDTFMKVNKAPSEDMQIQMQEVVNEQFSVASSFYTDIYQETDFGKLNFVRIDARINSIIDSKTGERVSDDFKKIIFQDLSFKPKLGSRYKFENNIWIVYSTDNVKSNTSSAYLRRCNNTMNTQDAYGKVHSEPCYIDYKPTKTSVLEYQEMTVPYTKQVLYCQLNKWTKNLGINDRFVFGSDAYKITDRVKFNRTETFNNNTLNLVRCYMDYDNLNEYDNVELGIANYQMPEYSIEVRSKILGKIGDVGTLSAKVLLNNKVTSESVYWYSQNSNVVTIDKNTGAYQLLTDGETTISVTMINNESYKNVISVSVSATVPEEYANVIDPDIRYIKTDGNQQYSVFETKNGTKNNTLFDITTSGVSNKFYDIIINGNEFSVHCKGRNRDNLLFVNCKNLRDYSVVSIPIELGGLF